MKKRNLCLLTSAIVMGLSSFGWVAAQSGSRGYAPPANRHYSGSATIRSAQGSAPRVEQTFESRLWTYLQKAQYRNWAPLPGQTDEAYDGNSPHGAKVKLYANRIAAGRSDEFRNGSILVKENYDASGEQLMAVTVMYRSAGYHPESGDWFWAKFEPNGSVSSMNGMPIAGRFNMCIECHQSAGNDDFVFANDR